MKITINLSCDPAGLQMDDCQIEKVVELSHEDFERLKITPLADQPFIMENIWSATAPTANPASLQRMGSSGSNPDWRRKYSKMI